MQDLDYAEMLEIPASTVTVTKKKSFFRRREQLPRDDLKERVVDSVNERVGAYVEGEDLSDPPEKTAKNSIKFGKDRESIILFSEIAAVCLIAISIFLTNIFMPTSAINTFISSLVNPVEETSEPSYNELALSSVVGSFSDAEVTASENGIITFRRHSISRMRRQGIRNNSSKRFLCRKNSPYVYVFERNNGH